MWFSSSLILFLLSLQEYACIMMAPFLVLIYEPIRLMENFGYTPGQPVNVLELGLGALLQLVAEFGVDLLCIRVEEREEIHVLEAWRQTGDEQRAGRSRVPAGATRRRVYLWGLAMSLVVAYHFISDVFSFSMPTPCMPYPCHFCVVDGTGGEHLSGGGSAAEVVLWCTEHLPGVGIENITGV